MQVPTKTWRNAMTIPRELSLSMVKDKICMTSHPLKEWLDNPENIPPIPTKTHISNGMTHLNYSNLPSSFILNFNLNSKKDFSLKFFNHDGNSLVVGYDSVKNKYYIDRRNAGVSNFNKDFPKVSFAPKIGNTQRDSITLVMDATSLELFADSGRTNLTSLIFPKSNYQQLQFSSLKNIGLKDFKVISTPSIWKSKP